MPIDDVEHLLGKTLLVGITYLDEAGDVNGASSSLGR
jgi:hypothetical protein